MERLSGVRKWTDYHSFTHSLTQGGTKILYLKPLSNQIKHAQKISKWYTGE